MTRERKTLDRAADRVMDLDSVANGDERERAVVMEAGTFGLTTGLYAGLLAAVVAALFGLVLLPLVLLAMTMLPSFAAIWYARRRDVDMRRLADDAGARSTTIGVAFAGSATVIVFAAMSYGVVTGQSLLPTVALEVTPGEGFLGGMLQGALIGGMLGGLAAVVGGILGRRRAEARRRPTTSR